MAVNVVAAFSLRKHLILEGLREAEAFSPETAKTLEEANVINPDAFEEYTMKLVNMGIICRTPGGKYYVKEES